MLTIYSKDVAYYCKTCDFSQRVTIFEYNAKTLKPPVTAQPVHRISITDPITKFTKRGSMFILAVVNYATNWPEAFP